MSVNSSTRRWSYAHHMGSSIDDAIALMARPGLESPIGPTAVYEVYGAWSEHVLSWTRKPHPAIYVMRYEDMLAHPEETFGGPQKTRQHQTD
jgi:hypothetical protein